jgi:hypothetical protein
MTNENAEPSPPVLNDDEIPLLRFDATEEFAAAEEDCELPKSRESEDPDSPP